MSDMQFLESELRAGRLSLAEALERVNDSAIQQFSDSTDRRIVESLESQPVEWDGQGDREPGEAWGQVEGTLVMLMDNRWTFQMYVAPLRVVSFVDGIFTLAAPGEHERAWCEARMTRLVERMLAGVLNMADVQVRFVAGGS